MFILLETKCGDRITTWRDVLEHILVHKCFVFIEELIIQQHKDFKSFKKGILLS